jgi:hypothetical protein
MDQIEIESWCVNQHAKSLGKAAFARTAVANDKCAQLQGFGHRNRDSPLAFIAECLTR